MTQINITSPAIQIPGNTIQTGWSGSGCEKRYTVESGTGGQTIGKYMFYSTSDHVTSTDVRMVQTTIRVTTAQLDRRGNYETRKNKRKITESSIQTTEMLSDGAILVEKKNKEEWRLHPSGKYS